MPPTKTTARPPAQRTTTKPPSSHGPGASPKRRRSSAPLARFRLDAEMARRGLADSREIAQRLIMAGRVRVNSRPAYKPDLKVDSETQIALMAGAPQFASRGAYKLIAALEHFGLSVEGRLAMDVGASTGGFTDVLLRRGAKGVIAMDVGYGQLLLKLREDPRVTVLDRMNIRLASSADLPFAPDVVTIDTSFISLRLVLPSVLPLLAPRAELIALIKPQFEVGKGKVGKGGVVRDEKLRREAVAGIVDFATSIGLQVVGTLESPIEGAAGNREHLALMKYTGASTR
ncbi:MAG TPA: TlyA family RNA methyltransferase [Candidatus Acidoferrales bacterium]|nr:TlyA family RNA methyltransferase [Candidatus Acidoferrales bacterium]